MSKGFTAKKLGSVAISRPGRSWRKRFSKRDLLFAGSGFALACLIFFISMLIQHAEVPLRPETATIDSPWIPSTVKHWQPEIDAMAKRYNIDPTFLAIIMTIESGGDPKANSGEATGLMQITPLTAEDIASKYIKTPVKHYNLFNPDTSIEFGAAYLSYLRNTFGSYNQGPTYDLTAEAVGTGYNGGPSAAASLLEGQGVVSDQTVLYSRDVLYFWRERHASSSPAYLRWRDQAGGIRLIQAAEQEQKS